MLKFWLPFCSCTIRSVTLPMFYFTLLLQSHACKCTKLCYCAICLDELNIWKTEKYDLNTAICAHFRAHPELRRSWCPASITPQTMGILMTDKLVRIFSSDKVITLDNLPLLTPSKQNLKLQCCWWTSHLALNQGSKSNTYPLEIPSCWYLCKNYQPTPTSVLHLLRKPDLQMGCWFWQWTLQIHGLLILAVNIADRFEWWSTCCVASSNFCCNEEWNWICQGWILFCEEPSQNCKSTTEKNQAPKGSLQKANIDWKHYTHSSVQNKLHQEGFKVFQNMKCIKL